MRSSSVPTQRNAGAVGLPADLARGPRPRRRARTAEVDAAVDHLGLRRRPRGRRPRAGRGASRRRRRPPSRAGPRGASRCRTRRERSRVLDVLAVGREDGRRPARERAEQPGGDEEVRVDDVGAEAARRPGDVAREDEVTRRARRAGRRPRGRARAPGPRALPRGPRRTSRASARSAPGTSARRAGSACGPGDRSAAGDLQDAEAHLVGRPLAPEDVARAALPERRVVPARDAHDVSRPGAGPAARACTPPASGSSSAGSRAGAARAACRGSARRGSSGRGGACGRRPPGS